MVFNNYKIPENIPAEHEFMYNLVDSLYTIGSNYGFVMGDFSLFIRKLEENENVPKELIEMAKSVEKNVDLYLAMYNKVQETAIERWKELGKPLSLEAHKAKKAQLDAEDDYRAEYCDR